MTLLPPPSEETTGRILVKWKRRDETDRTLLMMDGNGNNLQVIGLMSGAHAWSHSGRYIAIGCPSEDNIAREICILDASTIPDNVEFPSFNEDYYAKTVMRFGLPSQCTSLEQQVINSSVLEYYEGILSLSWSPDETQLVVVCGVIWGNGEHLQTCTLTMEGRADCWDSELGRSARDAVWSPKEDLIALTVYSDREYNIFIVKPDGTNPIQITNARGPAWSPDGTQIAFIRLEKDPRKYGVVLVNKDWSGEKWLYNSEKDRDSAHNEYQYWDGYISGYSGQIAWSPDGRYLAFLGSHHCCQAYNDYYRLDVKTGEIQLLLNRQDLDNFYIVQYPQWGQ
jgi:Tol biopolymer transport system component